MSRHLRLLDLALALLCRRKLKTLCTIGVQAGAVFLLASALFLGAASQHMATLLLSAAPEIVVQQRCAESQVAIELEWIEKLAALPGVRGVAARTWGYYRDPLTGANLLLMESGAGPGPAAALAEGVFPFGGDPLGCVIGPGVAALRQLETQDLLPVRGADGKVYALRVSGVFSPSSRLLTHDLVLLDRDRLRQIFHFPPGHATDLLLSLDTGSRRATVARTIKEHFPQLTPITREAALARQAGIFSGESPLIRLVWASGLGTLLILAWGRGYALDRQERSFVSLCRALGWHRAQVLELFFWEGLAVALPAFLIGLLAAHLHLFAAGAPLLMHLNRGRSLLPFPFELEPAISWLPLAGLCLLTVAPYCLARLWPAWRGAQRDPGEVLCC